MQMVDRSGGRSLDRIGDGENASGVAVDGHEHHAVALLLKLRGL